ncbi:ketopantoate reductase family protein [Emticicia sp. BO119]|uniref:ketopantoate reductase family protein n=1 Tax=Emticicia sp. BO119 TaxID=2757768 RepID=UPI0015F00BCD|nr:2-dehydropantoate 2-reductase [Emticicia sp. BO119]MBA4850832.1 2-dehydropantoate 2-reductase [Emticicia sp. BO119]
MKNQRNIYVVGAGAIGKALAIALKSADRNVVLLRATVTEPQETEKDLSLLLNTGIELCATIKISSINHFEKLNGIVILTNKSYGNKYLCDSLKEKTGDSPIVILQNGLGVEDIFIKNLFPLIYRCVLFATSQVIDNHKISFKPVSPSAIGVVKGNSRELSEIVEFLNTDLFPFKAEENIQKVIWKKAIINCVFNSVCPLIEADNGIFYRNSDVLTLAKRIVDECTQVANAYTIELTSQEVLESLLTISKLSDGQLISSYQDILNKRTTEIETLNFAVSKMAEAIGKAHLVKETRLSGELIKLKSDLSKNNLTESILSPI